MTTNQPERLDRIASVSELIQSIEQKRAQGKEP